MKIFTVLTLLISPSWALLQLASPTTAQPAFMHQTCYDDRGNYTANSQYHRNLQTLLTSLASDTQFNYGFYNMSVGKPPNQVNALALCRGDVGLDDCRGCISNATRQILNICPNQKHAIGVYDLCRLWYSDASIYGEVDLSRIFSIWNQNNASNQNELIQAQQTLFGRLRDETASGNSVRKFATGNQSVGFDTIFALMQCSPDLSSQGCDGCLSQVISYIGSTLAGKLAVSSTSPSCDVRYDMTLFYGPAIPIPPPPRQAPPPSDQPLPSTVHPPLTARPSPA